MSNYAMNQSSEHLSSYEFDDYVNASTCLSDLQEKSLRAALEDGLPLTPTPYRTLGNAIGLSEKQVMSTIQQWVDSGFIKRFGLIVRHRELGYKANAMVVWDFPDELVDVMGERFKQAPQVTLCYRRPRRLPEWPYNLFCMIHGQDRGTVIAEVDKLVDQYDLHDTPRALLFSKKRFKQRGGHFVHAN